MWCLELQQVKAARHVIRDAVAEQHIEFTSWRPLQKTEKSITLEMRITGRSRCRASNSTACAGTQDR